MVTGRTRRRPRWPGAAAAGAAAAGGRGAGGAGAGPGIGGVWIPPPFGADSGAEPAPDAAAEPPTPCS